MLDPFHILYLRSWARLRRGPREAEEEVDLLPWIYDHSLAAIEEKMVNLDRSVDFLEPDRLNFTDAAQKHLEDQRSVIETERPRAEHIAVMNLGIDGPWISFCEKSELSRRERHFVSENGLLTAMPLRLEDNETLMIDYIDDRLKIRELALVGGVDELHLELVALPHVRDVVALGHGVVEQEVVAHVHVLLVGRAVVRGAGLVTHSTTPARIAIGNDRFPTTIAVVMPIARWRR
jgi:hypothetical protein